jgi:hypothetical protein
MKRPASILPLLVAWALLGAGCSTVASRIEEKSAVFRALDPATQARLRAGVVEIGATQDMAYIALGAPDGQLKNASAAGLEQIWIYNNYSDFYAGTTMSYRPTVEFNPRTHATFVMLEPVPSPVFGTRVDERVRLTFKAGHVTAIEAAKPSP